MPRRAPVLSLIVLLAVLAALLAACASAAGQPVVPALAQSMPLPALAPAKPDSPGAALPAEQAAAEDVQAALPAVPPASCPVTVAPEQPFSPPAPWPPAAPYTGWFWHGSAALWTMLPADGAWAQLGRGEKVFWWREGYFWRDEPEPALTVTSRRLDGEAAEVRVASATNGYHPDLQSFMLTGVTVPSAGCWEVTGQYGQATLSFVVWVAP